MYISDVHLPYGDEEAIEQMFTSLKSERPELLVLGGDLCDFYKVSRYTKSPFNEVTLQNEIDETVAFLKKCRKLMKKGRIVWLEGNHEERLSKFLLNNAPELMHLRALDIAELFQLDKYNVEFMRDTEMFYEDDFLFRHGHEMMGMSGVPGNNARKGIATYHTNYIQGHVHKANIIHESNFIETYVGVENPCLCTIDHAYMKGSAKWQQGWTIGEQDEEGRWQIKQVIL